MEKILDETTIGQIRQTFTQIKEPVRILFFGSHDNCDLCADTQRLLEEVTALDEKLDLHVYDLQEDATVADKFNVDKAPGIVIAAQHDNQITDLGIQYSGIPSGHEFSTLISDILLVSNRDSGLSPKTREYLRNLDKPLLLQIFVTPSCPYCPRAVLLAHQMAMENPKMIHAEGVEATEFPELAQKFFVSGVPQTVINSGAGTVVGAVPEQKLLAEIMRAVN